MGTPGNAEPELGRGSATKKEARVNALGLYINKVNN